MKTKRTQQVSLTTTILTVMQAYPGGGICPKNGTSPRPTWSLMMALRL